MAETKLTTEELEAARDVEAYAWGSLDVSGEDALTCLLDLTPEGQSRVQALMMRRVEESRERERMYERTAEALKRLRERLEP